MSPVQGSCITHPTNGVIVDQDTNLLYVSLRANSGAKNGPVCVYDLPSLQLSTSLPNPIETGAKSGEPNVGLLRLTNGERRLYVSDDRRIYIHNATTGARIGEFSTGPTETVAGDNFYQVVYVPDEKGKTGVYVYNPDGVELPGSPFGGGGIFNSDEEGIWLYTCPASGIGDNGEGLIVVSDQKSPTDFEVFDRKTKQHLGKIEIAGVDGTDGIAFTQQSSPQYPLGIFAAIDNDTSTVGVGWDKILAATGLSCGQ